MIGLEDTLFTTFAPVLSNFNLSSLRPDRRNSHAKLENNFLGNSRIYSERSQQRPANSEALQVAAERPVQLLLLSGHQHALDEGEQLGGQPNVSSRQEAQDLDAVPRVLLRDEQQRPARRRSAVCLGLRGSLQGRKRTSAPAASIQHYRAGGAGGRLL